MENDGIQAQSLRFQVLHVLVQAPTRSDGIPHRAELFLRHLRHSQPTCA